MKKFLLSILFILIAGLSFGDANFNDDCIVNLADFAIFAADWLNSTPLNDPDTDLDADGTVEIDDLSLFADEWLTYKTLDRAPVAADQSTYVFNNTTKTITLSATDGNGDPLTYSILSLPGASQGQITGVSSVPHTLAGNTFVFDPNNSYSGTVTISFGADDSTGLTPPCGGQDTGTVTIEVYDTPVDPTATAVNASAYECVETEIELVGEDDGWPNPPNKIRYIITQLPTDANLLDPQAGNALISKVPYTLSGWESNLVNFVSGTVGADSFQYKVNDGENDSSAATVSVTVSDFPDDSLTFDGDGYVTFADNAKYDMTDGWGVDFWIKTRHPFSGLMKKRGSSGTGYEVGIVSGKPKVYLYNSSNDVETFRYPFRVDDGDWHEISIIFYENGGNYKVAIEMDSQQSILGTASETSYANAEPLIVGLHARDGYKYEFDKLRFFSGLDPETYYLAFLQGFSGRTESGGETVLGFGKVSDVLFMCDEGTGTTITDSKLSLTGTFNSSSNVLWQPPCRLFHDTTIPSRVQP